MDEINIDKFYQILNEEKINIEGLIELLKEKKKWKNLWF